MPRPRMADPNLILTVTLTPAGATFRPYFLTTGMTPADAGRVFGAAARGLADSAARMRAALESAEPGAGDAFAAGYAAAAGAAVGRDEVAVAIVFPPPPPPAAGGSE